MQEHGGSSKKKNNINHIILLLIITTILQQVQAQGWVITAEYHDKECKVETMYVVHPIGVCSVSTGQSSIIWNKEINGTLIKSICNSADCTSCTKETVVQGKCMLDVEWPFTQVSYNDTFPYHLINSSLVSIAVKFEDTTCGVSAFSMVIVQQTSCFETCVLDSSFGSIGYFCSVPSFLNTSSPSL